jgi:sigma-B regulation protein RsbU (phosphoserine phosphatase)
MTKHSDELRRAKEVAEALGAINRISVIVNQSLKLNEILQGLCKELPNIFPIRNAGIGLLSEDKHSLEIVAFHSVDPDEKSAMGLKLPVDDNSHTYLVIQNKKTVVIQDAQSDPRTSSIADVSKTRGTKSIMIVPLLARGEAIGTIGMPARDPDYIFSDREVELAETIGSQISATIDNARLFAQVESALDVAERDLEIGRQIQAGFFPEKLPEIPGWELAAHFEAARQVAGDFYDVFQLGKSNLTAFVIADVCDKGVGAALFMVLFRSLLRAYSEMHFYSNDIKEKIHNIILCTNNYIAEIHGSSNMFATIFFGVLDPGSGILTYVNGGHEPPVILDRYGKVIKRLMPTGPAVGLFPDMIYQVDQIQLHPGDMLVGYTDGVADALDRAGIAFSEPRLLKSISVPWTSIFSMLFELLVELHHHMGGRKQYDDITLLSFRRKLTEDVVHHAICRQAEIEILPEIRNFIASAAEHSGLKHDEVHAFQLAGDEICTNIINYGFVGQEPGFISIFFDVDRRTARLTIRDDGKHFPPEQAAAPDLEASLEERQIGGLGIYLVKALMDRVEYDQSSDGVNRLVLEKGLH